MRRIAYTERLEIVRRTNDDRNFFKRTNRPMESQKSTDSWSSLLSQLGVDAPAEELAPVIIEPETQIKELEDHVKPERIEEPVHHEEPEYRSNVSETTTEESKEKRTFLGRFPKINIFGASPKDPLDAVVSGTKPTTKSGEAFTSKKLEKVEPPPGRTIRREAEPITPELPPVAKPVSKGRDPWSMIASQVGNIAVLENDEAEAIAPEPVTSEPVTEQSKTESSRRGRRTPPSMFDDEPVEESKESTAVRSILDADEPKPFADAAERLNSIFDDKPHRNDKEPERREQRQHVRGQRYGEFRQEPAKENDDAVQYREERKFDDQKRGERSSGDRSVRKPERERYGKKEHTEKRERGSRWEAPPKQNDDDFKAESTWNIEEESKPVERSGRRRSRRGERSEQDTSHFREGRTEVATLDDAETFTESGDLDQLHRSIPSWDDAISSIIEANTARRTKRGSEPRRGKSVRR